ncbi:MAG: hypothetical protein LBQ21_02415 [Clostridiales Family XIII bacterium]|jgi:hypothetical protein|nr:hypothetical protein [Clostridiales Family XIII bacterium]
MVNTEVGSICNSGTRALNGEVRLVIDGKEIEMVPFVKNILSNTVIAVVKELEGYSESARIEVTID